MTVATGAAIVRRLGLEKLHLNRTTVSPAEEWAAIEEGIKGGAALKELGLQDCNLYRATQGALKAAAGSRVQLLMSEPVLTKEHFDKMCLSPCFMATLRHRAQLFEACPRSHALSRSVPWN